MAVKAGTLGERRHDEIAAALKTELAKHQRPNGIVMDSSSWKVSARNPGQSGAVNANTSVIPGDLAAPKRSFSFAKARRRDPDLQPVHMRKV